MENGRQRGKGKREHRETLEKPSVTAGGKRLDPGSGSAGTAGRMMGRQGWMWGCEQLVHKQGWWKEMREEMRAASHLLTPG